MPKPYSDYTKHLVVYHHRQGLKPGDISQILQKEGIMASRRRIAKFVAKCIESGSVARKPGSWRPSKVTAVVWKIIEEAMCTDDETMAKAYLKSSVSSYARNREKTMLTFAWKNRSHFGYTRRLTLWLHAAT